MDKFFSDHLDFHKSMSAYWQAKWRPFLEQLSPQSKAVFNWAIDPFPQVVLW